MQRARSPKTTLNREKVLEKGDRGLGTQTGGAGGGESEPMRGSTHSGQGTAAHGGAPNEETRDDD